MRFFNFTILSLAVWRISNMLVAEDGPWMVFEHLRLKVGLQPAPYADAMRETDPPGKMPGTLLNCVWCTSVWIAGFFVALYLWKRRLAHYLALPFALSAIACLIDRHNR